MLDHCSSGFISSSFIAARAGKPVASWGSSVRLGGHHWASLGGGFIGKEETSVSLLYLLGGLHHCPNETQQLFFHFTLTPTSSMFYHYQDQKENPNQSC